MELNGQRLTLTDIAAVALGHATVEIASSARPRILASRKLVEEIIARDVALYGVSTGFSKLSDLSIPHDALGEHQLNLVRSHACGIGRPISDTERPPLMVVLATVLVPG